MSQETSKIKANHHGAHSANSFSVNDDPRESWIPLVPIPADQPSPPSTLNPPKLVPDPI